MTSTLQSVAPWSDEAMRGFLESLMTERTWDATRLASELGAPAPSVEKWLAGDPSQTVFRSKLRRYLEQLGYPDRLHAVAPAPVVAPAEIDPQDRLRYAVMDVVDDLNMTTKELAIALDTSTAVADFWFTTRTPIADGMPPALMRKALAFVTGNAGLVAPAKPVAATPVAIVPRTNGRHAANGNGHATVISSMTEPAPVPVTESPAPVIEAAAPEPSALPAAFTPIPDASGWYPFPAGFAVVMAARPALVIVDGETAINRDLWTALGRPSHVIIGANEATGQLAIAACDAVTPFAQPLIDREDPLDDVYLPASVAWHIGFADGVFRAVEDGRCWICTREQEDEVAA